MLHIDMSHASVDIEIALVSGVCSPGMMFSFYQARVNKCREVSRGILGEVKWCISIIRWGVSLLLEFSGTLHERFATSAIVRLERNVPCEFFSQIVYAYALQGFDCSSPSRDLLRLFQISRPFLYA